MTSRLPQVCLALALGVSLAACAGESSGDASSPDRTSQVTEAGRPDVDESLLREGRSGADRLNLGAPDEVAAAMPVVLTGRFVEWVPGPDALTTIDGEVDREAWAVAVVDVDDIVEGRDAVHSDGRVYVRVYRGGEPLDSDLEPIRGAGDRSAVTPIASLRRATPEGVRVAVMGAVVDRDQFVPDGGVSEDAGVGLPDDAPVVQVHGQGLIFEDGDGSLVSSVHEGPPETWQGWQPPASTAKSSGTDFDWLVGEVGGSAG